MNGERAAALDLAPIKDKLRELIAETAGIPQELITDDATFKGALAMDSLSFVNFQVEIERTFDIDCALDELRDLTQFEQVVRLVAGKVERR
jgi:acyl carrier protein